MRSLLTILPFVFYMMSGFAQGKRNYLQGAVTPAAAKAITDGLSGWRSQRKAELFEKAAALPDSVKRIILQQADSANAYGWPSLQATDFLKFKLTGNRTDFEKPLLERRKMIRFLLLGEMVERKGKYLPQLINGLWLTCEESTWNLPAHLYTQPAGIDLPQSTENPIDLFTGEASAMVAWCTFLMGDEMAKTSPVAVERMRYEMNRRLVEPFLNRYFGWMALKGETANNWNIWINTNILLTVLYGIDDAGTIQEVLLKSAQSADAFINGYPEDGGIDEGPSYWRRRAARLVEYLDLLCSASKGEINLSNKPLLHAIGSYIYKAHIGGTRYINPADAYVSISPSSVAAVYRYGRYFNDDALKGFAAYLLNAEGNGKLFGNVLYLTSGVDLLDVYTAIANIKPSLPRQSGFWFPGIQQLTARQHAGSTEGLFFFAQGGHNAESHNHNDVGNFTIYVDGRPVIADAGAGTYTKETFGPNRYTIWNMQSGWHNCPTINGQMQGAGRAYEATDVRFEANQGTLQLSMNLAQAYPPAAAVKKWERRFTFNRAKGSVVLEEDYVLQKLIDTTSLNFLLASPPVVRVGGFLLPGPKGNKGLLLLYNQSDFDFKLEQSPLLDERLKQNWEQQHLYRLVLLKKGANTSGRHRIEFRLSNEEATPGNAGKKIPL